MPQISFFADEIASLCYDTDPRGVLSRLEPDTAFLTRGIAINGHYLLTKSCDLYPRQEIDLEFKVQGGPRGAIANIGKKSVEGRIVCPIYVLRDGTLDPAIRELLLHAESPFTPLRIDTNHAFSHLSLTAEHGGSDDNRLISFDGMVIKELSVSAVPDRDVELNVDFVGRIDARQEAEYIEPPELLLRRRLGFQDCDAFRLESAMRTVIGLEIRLINDTDTPTFLVPDGSSLRDDQFAFVGVKSTKWGGNFEEMLRKGAEKESYLHGGWMVGENLVLNFGPFQAQVRVPLFKIGEQPLSDTLLKRKTEFWVQISPDIQGRLFEFLEG